VRTGIKPRDAGATFSVLVAPFSARFAGSIAADTPMIMGRRGNAALPGIKSGNWRYSPAPIDLHVITALEKEGGNGQMEKGKKELRSRSRQRDLMRRQSSRRLGAYSSRFVPILFPRGSRFELIPPNPTKSDLKKVKNFSPSHMPPAFRIPRSEFRVKLKLPNEPIFKNSQPAHCNPFTTKPISRRVKNKPISQLSAPRRGASAGRSLGRHGNAAVRSFWPLISPRTSLLYSPPEPCVCRSSFRLRKEVNV
jgi:hypothetical protein